MMRFSETFQRHAYWFYDGPMETRIEYSTDLKLDKEMSIFRLLDTETGREALASLYRTDIETSLPFNLPIILNAPTFRASKEHCRRLGIPQDAGNIAVINERCIAFVKGIRDEYPAYKNNIFVTAPVGPKYAGFTPDTQHHLAEEIAYHQEQIAAIAKAGVNVISIAAMPGGVECLGAAIAASDTDIDYTVGFVVTAAGTLLDGTPIEQAIREIDRKTARKPLGYIIGCTHPSIAEKALAGGSLCYQRIIGIKANGSAKPPKALLKLNKPEADDPKCFAEALIKLGKPRGFKIYGGCCGTDHSHLEAMLEHVSKQ